MNQTLKRWIEYESWFRAKKSNLRNVISYCGSIRYFPLWCLLQCHITGALHQLSMIWNIIINNGTFWKQIDSVEVLDKNEKTKFSLFNRSLTASGTKNKYDEILRLIHVIIPNLYIFLNVHLIQFHFST